MHSNPVSSTSNNAFARHLILYIFVVTKIRVLFHVKLSHTEIHKGVTRGDQILIEATFDTNDPCLGTLVVICVTAMFHK